MTEAERLRAALETARDTIQELYTALQDHADGVATPGPKPTMTWQEYSRHAPEMLQIDAALSLALAAPTNEAAKDLRIAELEAERDRWRKIATDPATSKHPTHCPVTGLPFFMTIEHPQRGMIATYGGPFDSYTIPERDPEDGNQFVRERFDHDRGVWIEGVEAIGVYAVTEDELAEHAEVKAERDRLARELAEAQKNSATWRRLLANLSEYDQINTIPPMNGHGWRVILQKIGTPIRRGEGATFVGAALDAARTGGPDAQ